MHHSCREAAGNWQLRLWQFSTGHLTLEKTNYFFLALNGYWWTLTAYRQRVEGRFRPERRHKRSTRSRRQRSMWPWQIWRSTRNWPVAWQRASRSWWTGRRSDGASQIRWSWSRHREMRGKWPLRRWRGEWCGSRRRFTHYFTKHTGESSVRLWVSTTTEYASVESEGRERERERERSREAKSQLQLSWRRREAGRGWLSGSTAVSVVVRETEQG